MEFWERGKYSLKNHNKSFAKILNFYLFNCPVYNKDSKKSTSVRGKTFKDRKIQKGELISLLNAMKGKIDYYEVVSSLRTVESSVKEYEKNNKNKQFLIFKENQSLGKTQSIFYAIRNALAHGSFSTEMINNEKYYYFENKSNKCIEAQFELKENVLLEWIKLVNKKEYKKQKK